MFGPQATDRSKFQGFGMKLGAKRPGDGPAPAGVGAPKIQGFGISTSKATAQSHKRKATTNAVAGMFGIDDDEVDDQGATKTPSWSKLTTEQTTAMRKADEMQQLDPSVFQYDEVIDDVKISAGIEAPCQAVRTDVLTQKKRTGLVLPSGPVGVRTGDKREPKYIDKVIVATDRRKVEQQIVEDRLLKKELDANKDREVFVTPAFKEELARRKKFEQELETKEMIDNRTAAEGQANGLGFASFHRNLLDGGLASGRGGEKLIERAKAKEDIKDEPKEETKEEADDINGEELGVKDVKEEPTTASVDNSSTSPAQAAAEKAKVAAEELEARKSKTLSAKDRYLARKKLENS